MKYQEAKELFEKTNEGNTKFLKSRWASRVIKQLMSYEAEKSWRDNLATMGLKNHRSLYMLVNKYNLPKYTREDKHKNFRDLWDTEQSVSQNAKRLGVTPSYAFFIKKKFGLPHTKGGRDAMMFTKFEVAFLRKRGYSFEAMGRLFGVTRQAVNFKYQQSINQLPKTNTLGVLDEKVIKQVQGQEK